MAVKCVQASSEIQLLFLPYKQLNIFTLISNVVQPRFKIQKQLNVTSTKTFASVQNILSQNIHYFI